MLTTIGPSFHDFKSGQIQMRPTVQRRHLVHEVILKRGNIQTITHLVKSNQKKSYDQKKPSPKAEDKRKRTQSQCFTKMTMSCQVSVIIGPN